MELQTLENELAGDQRREAHERRPQEKQEEEKGRTYRFWALDENLCPSQLPLVWFHVDGTHEVLYPVIDGPIPARIRLRRQNGVPRQEGVTEAEQNMYGGKRVSNQSNPEEDHLSTSMAT